MSAFGTKRTSQPRRSMSAFGGKVDIAAPRAAVQGNWLSTRGQSRGQIWCRKLNHDFIMIYRSYHRTECPLWVKSRHRRKSGQCPLYPQKRTLELSRGMSALCQKRTHARQQKFCHLPCAQRNAPAVLTQFFPTLHMRLSALSQANSPEYRGGRVFKACR